MSTTIYERRVEQEWRLLQQLAAANPRILRMLDRTKPPGGQLFHFNLDCTLGISKQDGDLTLIDTHAALLYFPRFFPAVPIEARLNNAVYHPNVDPVRGFVCLWSRFSPGDTVIEAVAQLQRVITWTVMNEQEDHLLQPDSLSWFRDDKRTVELPLFFEPVVTPKDFQMERSYWQPPAAIYRRRLQ